MSQDKITLSSQSNYTYNYLGSDVIRYSQSTNGSQQFGIINLDSWTEDDDLSEWLHDKVSATLGTTEVSVDITASDFVNYAEFTINTESQGAVNDGPAWMDLADEEYYSAAWNNAGMFAFATSASENWTYTRSANSFEVSHELNVTTNSRSSEAAAGGKGKLTSSFDGATNLNNTDTAISNKSQLAVGTPEMASTTSFAREVFAKTFKAAPGDADIYIDTPLDVLTCVKGANIDSYFEHNGQELADQWPHQYSETSSNGGNSTTYKQTFSARNPDYDNSLLDVTRRYQSSRSNGYLYCTEENSVKGLGSNAVSNTQKNPEGDTAAAALTRWQDIQGLVDFFNTVKVGSDKDYLKDPDDEDQPFVIRTSRTTYSHLSESLSSRTITNDPAYSGINVSGTSGASGTGLCITELTIEKSLQGCYNLDTYSASFQGITRSGSKDNRIEQKDRLDLAISGFEQKMGELRATGEGTLAATSLRINSKEAQVLYTTSFSEDPTYEEGMDEGGFKMLKKSTTTNVPGESKNYYYPIGLLENNDKNVIVNGAVAAPLTTSHSLTYVGGTGHQGGVPDPEVGLNGTSQDKFFD